MRLLDGVTASASLSPCGTYRYMLSRRWLSLRVHSSEVAWLMLNPSTADADTDDNTIRKCITFSRAWGYTGLTVVNLFALRSSSPKALYAHPDPIGEANDIIIETVATSPYTGLVVAAWGVLGAYRNRGLIVTRNLTAVGVRLHRLGPPTKGGHPSHPLYLSPYTPLEAIA